MSGRQAFITHRGMVLVVIMIMIMIMMMMMLMMMMIRKRSAPTIAKRVN